MFPKLGQNQTRISLSLTVPLAQGQVVFLQYQTCQASQVHAEHLVKNAVTDKTILWNNFYEYQFSNADKVDFFITATERQRSIMLDQFNKYTPFTPNIV